MSTESTWAGWVDAARGGDASAREELANYFTPFVHGVLLCRLAVTVANEHVKPVLDEALRDLGDAKGFGPRLMACVRRRAQEVASRPGRPLQLPGDGAPKALAKIQLLSEASRERLVLRLVEGITGAEIAEVTGVPPNEVRVELERAAVTLVLELTGQTITLTSNDYLWSLLGAPHAAIVPLENELTPLRYDGNVVAARVPLRPAGVVAGLTDDTTGAGAAIVERTETGGRALEEDVTSPSGLALNPFAVEPPTQRNSDLPAAAAAEHTLLQQTGTQRTSDLPAAAQAPNPFTQHAETHGVPDLPAEAQGSLPPEQGTLQHYDVIGAVPVKPPEPRAVTASTRNERASQPGATVNARGEKATPASHPMRAVDEGSDETPAAPIPASGREPSVVVSTQEDTDATAPRGTPLSMLVKGWQPPAVPSTAPPSYPALDETTGLGQPIVAPPPERKPRFSRGARPFVVAGVLVGLGVTVATTAVRYSQREATRGWALVPVLVAAQNIPEGTAVTTSMVSTREVPEQFVTSSVVKPDAVSFIANQRIMVPVQAGDPLLWSEFETAFSSERLSKRVQRQGRAFTIEAATIVSVGGWIRPGDHIDIIVTVLQDEPMEPVATTTLQNLMVLATGKISPKTNVSVLKPAEKEYANVSVLALPEEAEILALMRAKASYQLVLRNEEDYGRIDLKPTTPSSVLNPAHATQLSRGRSQLLRGTRTAGEKGTIVIPEHWAPWVNLHPGLPEKPPQGGAR